MFVKHANSLMPVKVCLCFQKLASHITVMHSKELSCIARNFKRPRLVFSALVLDGVLVHLKRFSADLLFVKTSSALLSQNVFCQKWTVMFLISDRNKGKTGIGHKICFNPVFVFYYFYYYYNCCDHRHNYFYFEHYCYMFVSFLCSFLFPAKQRLLKDGKKEIMTLLYVGKLASVYKISVYYFLSSLLVHLLI